MKGKITVVFLSLVLVFGMIAASCDNGAFPEQKEKDASTLIVYKQSGDTGLPTANIDVLPTRLSAADLEEALKAKVANPAGSKNFVDKYKIGTVSTTPPATYGDTKYSEDDLKIAQKYAGLKILVEIVYATP